MTRRTVFSLVCLLVLVVSSTAHAQSANGRDIFGTVVDIDANPVADATVSVAGGGPSTVTATDGSFKLTGVATTNVVVEITAAGFTAKQILVLGLATALQLQVMLVKAPTKAAVAVTIGASAAPVRAHAKEESVVVDGRTPVIITQNRATGSSVIDDKDLNRVSADTLDAAMTGKLAGADVQANSWAPGGGALLRLRGTSTIFGQSSPLYVIDGVVISNVSVSSGANATPELQTLSRRRSLTKIAVSSGANAMLAMAADGSTAPDALTQNSSVNRIADLNPNDIETLEVLKGASAAALYGSKAANGVVIITTKRGHIGENHATVTQRFGFVQPSNKLGSRTFATIEDVRATFCGAQEPVAQCDATPQLQAYIAANGQTYDHEAEILRTAFAMETAGTVSGGTDNATYYGSVLYRDAPGVVIGTFYRKQNGRAAVDYKLGARVRLSVAANLVHSISDRGLTNNDNPGGSLYAGLSSTPSFVDLQPQRGVYPANLYGGANTLQTVSLLKNREEVWRLITGSTLSIDAYNSSDGTSTVKLLGNFGTDRFTQKNTVLSPNALLFESDDSLPGTLINTATTNANWNVGAGALWTLYPQSRKFRSALSAGFTYGSVDLDSVSIVAKDLIAGQPNVGAARSVTATEDHRRTKDSGVYAQQEIAVLDGRLSLLAGVFGERSSGNGDTHKYYFFPKLVAVYSLGKEGSGAREVLDMFGALRVRAAYGEAGKSPNLGIRGAQFKGAYNIGGHAGLILASQAIDPSIEPERQREVELGLDLATKDQRVVAEVTGYQRTTSSLVFSCLAAPSSGVAILTSNCGGSVGNRGIEAAVLVRPIVTREVEWTSRGTLTLNRSVITDLANNLPYNIPIVGSNPVFGAYRIQEGKSPTEIVASIDVNEVAVVGNGEPDFRIGWSNVVSVGDFTFAALLDWQHGSNIVNLTRWFYDELGNSPDGEAAAQRIEAFHRDDARPYIEDASFVKVRELSVGYTLPKRLVEQLGPVRRLEFSLSGRNLVTFTRYSGLDPEASSVGSQPIGRNYDIAPYPPSRSYWFSVTAGL